MVDKLRRTAPLNITFADGEQPVSEKLSAINNQFRASTNVLEKAIGDTWNQSGDSLLRSSPLQIANIARTIGEQQHMNPDLYSLTENFDFTENIGVRYAGRTEFYLLYQPASPLVHSVSALGAGFASLQATEAAVQATGQYWIDSSTGRVRTYTPVAALDTLTYEVDTSNWTTNNGLVPSVIPDPGQTTFTSCRISKTGSTYFIHLPPRRPLSSSSWNKYPALGEQSGNEDSTVPGAGVTKKLWQDGSVAALNDAYYRYRLPKEIDDALAGMALGETLPKGMLLLWDGTANTVIVDAVFKKNSAALGSWVFEISSVSTTSLILADRNNTLRASLDLATLGSNPSGGSIEA